MLNYTWRLSSLKSLTTHKGLTSPIVSVYWRLQAVDEDNFTEKTGVQDFDIANLDEDNFVSFSDLSKNDIISWVQQALGTEEIALLKTSLQAELNTLKGT